EEVKRLGGEPIAFDAGRNDGKLVSQLQTLISQKPDAIFQILGTLSVIDPWLKKARDAPVIGGGVVDRIGRTDVEGQNRDP
ncbi:hypothetical protein ACC757_37530, partial [Rhizobium ruizarguesonis]